MSDAKRILLPQIADTKKSTNCPQPIASSNSSSTIRLELNLFEPNADSFPEFNYSKLLHVEKKKKKKISKINGFTSADPFEENNDDLNRIAKEFERKYGNAYCGRKGRSNNEYCDKGAGYDENDDFIDNTEAYDEIIPDEIETDRGGFYINSGALQFKQLPNFERPDDALRMPKPRKRQLSTSSESSQSETDVEKKAMLKNGHIEKKTKIIDKEAVAKVKDKKVEKIKIKERKDDGAGSDSGKDSKKPIKTTTVKDMLRAKRDSMRNTIIEGGNKSEQTEDSQNESSSSDDSDESSDDDRSDMLGKKDNSQRSAADIKLPDNLPTDLLEYINKIVEAAKTNSTGKHNFFDSTNMDLLYKIETMARSKGPNARNQIYNYLEVHLPCTKQTILMRAKKIRIQKEENKTNKILAKLKVAVDNIMPDLLTNYETECKRISELRAAATAISQNGTNGGEKSETNYKMPRKRFSWTDETRNLNYELMNARRQSFSVIKPRKETLEDFVSRFLKESVLKIWPEGWIKLEDLQKEYEKRKVNVLKSKEMRKSAAGSLTEPGTLPLAATTTTTITAVGTTTTTTTTTTTAAAANIQKEPLPLITTNNNVLPSKSLIPPPQQQQQQSHSMAPPTSSHSAQSIKDQKTTSNNSILHKTNDSKVTTIPTSKSDTKPNVASMTTTTTTTAAVAATSTSAVDNSIVMTSIAPISSSTASGIPTISASTPSFGSSLTITPIGANDVTTKPLPSVQNKVTITSSTVLSNDSKEVALPTKSNSITSSINNTTVTTISNSKPINLTTTTTTAATDHSVSTPKRSTDHSINSIISSSPNNNNNNSCGSTKSDTTIDITSPTKKTASSSTPPKPPSSPRSVTGASGTSTVSATASVAATAAASATTTHVINLDNLKNKNDILNTAAAQSKATTTTSSSSSSTASNDFNIRIRSVETVNNSLDNVAASTPSIYSIKNSKPSSQPPIVTIISDDIEEIDSSSSDDVEFVGVSVSNVKRRRMGPRSKTLPPYINKLKYHKKDGSNTNSRSSSPKITHVTSLATSSSSAASHKSINKLPPNIKDECKRKNDTVLDNKDGDFDVNQIMKELKELQEMQNKASNIHLTDNSSSHQKGSLHHSTSLPYKKLEISENTTQLSRSSS